MLKYDCMSLVTPSDSLSHSSPFYSTDTSYFYCNETFEWNTASAWQTRMCLETFITVITKCKNSWRFYEALQVKSLAECCTSPAHLSPEHPIRESVSPQYHTCTKKFCSSMSVQRTGNDVQGLNQFTPDIGLQEEIIHPNELHQCHFICTYPILCSTISTVRSTLIEYITKLCLIVLLSNII